MAALSRVLKVVPTSERCKAIHDEVKKIRKDLAIVELWFWQFGFDSLAVLSQVEANTAQLLRTHTYRDRNSQKFDGDTSAKTVVKRFRSEVPTGFYRFWSSRRLVEWFVIKWFWFGFETAKPDPKNSYE